MLGSPLARAAEAPGRGTNWGMAAPSPVLPRGTRIKVGTAGTLERILARPGARHRRHAEPRRRPAPVDGRAGRADDRARCSDVEMVYAPSVATEGKSWQRGR